MPVTALRWYIHSRVAGAILFAAGMTLMGLGVAQAVTTPVSEVETQTQTLHHTRLVTHTRYITVRVKGHVIRRHDHVLVVYVPRTVFRNHVTEKRVVVPAHVVRIREPSPPPGWGVTSAAVIGVAPPAEVVTVQVPVVIPGPVTTVTSVEMVTLPQQTTTVTLPQDTTTVTLPPTSG
jgi:hypothetical protein